MILTIQKANRFLSLAVLVALGASASNAWASAWGPYIEMTAYPSYSEKNNAENKLGGSTSGAELKPTTGFAYDLRNTLGVKPVEWLVIGASFNYASAPEKTAATPTADAREIKNIRQEWGATLGFLHGNWRIMGTYLFTGRKKFTEIASAMDGTIIHDELQSTKLKSGFQVIAGYSIPFSSAFRIGPTLVYRNVTYKGFTKLQEGQSVADQDFTTPAKESALLPMVTMSLSF